MSVRSGRKSSRRPRDDDGSSSLGASEIYLPAMREEDAAVAGDAFHRTGALEDGIGVTVSLPAFAGAKASVVRRMSQHQVVQAWKAQASAFVETLAAAARRDEQSVRAGQPALERIQLIPALLRIGGRVAVHETLLEAGFLNQLAGLIADPKRKQLAPYDLRCAAFDILEQFAVEGVHCGRLPPKPKIKKGGFGGGEDLGDEVTYHGITIEQLKEAAALGRAIFCAQQHPEETTENRRRATVLLERFSRAFHGVVDAAAGGGTKQSNMGAQVRWKHMQDATILPPFEALQGDAERYMSKFARVDPLDPSSYSRVPEVRRPPAYITALYFDQGLRGTGPDAKKGESDDD